MSTRIEKCNNTTQHTKLFTDISQLSSFVPQESDKHYAEQERNKNKNKKTQKVCRLKEQQKVYKRIQNMTV